jgi:amidase
MREVDILRKSAVEQGVLVRSRALSSEELTEIYLRRIAERDPEIHAFVQVLGDEALRAARKADRDKPPPGARFWGVPIGIKDLNAVRGSFLRMGSRAFSRFLSPADDLVVARLRRAGFIMLGKTSTPELGCLPVTEPETHAPTRNPWDRSVTPGGSSGGAAAALAADMLPIAQGSDGGGSVRIPAALCGLVGFKPTQGIVENPFGMTDPDIVWTCGPIARSVADAAAMVDAMTDPPADGIGFFEQSRRPLRRLKVCVATDTYVVPTEPEIRDETLRIARMVASLGHDVDERSTLSGVSVEEFIPIWQKNVARAPVLDWSETEPLTRWFAEGGKGLDVREVASKVASIAERVIAGFGDADVWIMPTVSVSPFPIGTLGGLPPLEAFHRAAHLGAFTAPFNVSGQPAISIPAGLSSKGHPIGVQLVGRKNDDGTILSLARALEEQIGWKTLGERAAG